MLHHNLHVLIAQTHAKIEHHSVLHVFEQLEREGYDVTYLDVDDTGAIDLMAPVSSTSKYVTS
jgi:cysteine desulfurase